LCKDAWNEDEAMKWNNEMEPINTTTTTKTKEKKENNKNDNNSKIRS
jgi:hypothetical protein